MSGDSGGSGRADGPHDADDSRDADDARDGNEDRPADPPIDGVRYRAFGDEWALATRGDPLYGEATDGDWRRWRPGRSKLAATIDRGLPVGLSGDDRVLYLGAAGGTTAGHVADFARAVYAVEFAPRPARDLVETARSRDRLFPLLKDARTPESYAHVVESDLDAVVQDVATRGQAEVALRNRQYLADDGRLVATIKARSEDVARDPSGVFDDALERLREGYEVLATERLDPTHVDHLAVVARPR